MEDGSLSCYFNQMKIPCLSEDIYNSSLIQDKIKFKLFSFIKFFYWCTYIDNHKHNENMKKVLELVQEDIDNIRRQSEKEIREAEKITNEIGGRL